MNDIIIIQKLTDIYRLLTYMAVGAIIVTAIFLIVLILIAIDINKENNRNDEL